MRKLLIMMLTALFVLGACGTDTDETEESSNGAENEEDRGEIVFGQTSWTSTEAPTEIAKQILEEAGYEVEVVLLDQPVIWEGLATEEIDFFMDAWLPYTEEALWEEYQDVLQQVAVSYEDVPLGFVVPEYVEEETIDDLAGKAEKFDGEVVTIDDGAGIVEIAKQVFADEYYDLEEYELVPTSEAAMLAVMEDKISSEEPFIITGWRPHSMFSRHDLKFLEDTQEHYQYDNVYVLSYNGIEEKYPEAYEILSQWSIEVDELEDMMFEYENNGVAFEESAEVWIEENREIVDEWLNN
ncbi:glycine betaine ABC transporter substrate-binding protein [Virgibacillus kimchii]